MDTVTGTVVEAGEIPVLDGADAHIYKRALIIQFDSTDDMKAAMTGVKQIRTEWLVSKENTDNG